LNFWCRNVIMKCRSKKNPLSVLPNCKGFSLPEVMAALTILALASVSVLVVIDRCMASAADSQLRMHAFEVARDNMEKLLAASSVKETVEYGSSDKYPEIQWQTVVETFSEPVTSKMWIQAICSAEYTDTEGQTQTVELTHWLTGLTEAQAKQILEAQEKQKERLAEADQLLEGAEEAADCVGVDVETIQQWVENGMVKTEDGYYIKIYLELYQEYDGDPTPEAKSEVAKTYAVLKGGIGEPGEPPPEEPSMEKLQQQLRDLGPDAHLEELLGDIDETKQ